MASGIVLYVPLQYKPLTLYLAIRYRFESQCLSKLFCSWDCGPHSSGFDCTVQKRGEDWNFYIRHLHCLLENAGSGKVSCIISEKKIFHVTYKRTTLSSQKVSVFKPTYAFHSSGLVFFNFDFTKELIGRQSIDVLFTNTRRRNPKL